MGPPSCRVRGRSHVGQCLKESITCYTCDITDHNFMNCPQREQGSVAWSTGSTIGSSISTGSAEPGVELGRVHGWFLWTGESAGRRSSDSRGSAFIPVGLDHQVDVDPVLELSSS
ncbi:hypothetical protein HAX54_025104 [Datura stramonium]|uniref:Uncharacterized protein n=1 Tax=Datura stramonium TaxID=4076 RepID=A0ABS8V1J2_DATST|nr:hypothetical protein [Datura stramonium]